MSEIIFSCECGMTLKLNDADYPDGKVACPSCKTTVRIPSVRKTKVAPSVLEAEEEEFDEPEPESTGHQGLGLLYLGLVSLLTIGAVAFFLLPALSGINAKAPERVLASKSSNDLPSKPKPKTKPSSSKKLSRPTRVIPERLTTEPVEKAAEDEVVSSPTEPPADPPDPPTPPRSRPVETKTKKQEIPAPPRRILLPPPSEIPKSTVSKLEVPKSEVLKSGESPYAHIKDPAARQSLEFALKNAKIASSAGTALRLMSAAERQSNNDPDVLAETKKLRDMINDLRSKVR